jgi:Tol biopolymer transport system component
MATHHTLLALALISCGACRAASPSDAVPLFGRVVYSQGRSDGSVALYSMAPDGSDRRLLKKDSDISLVAARVSPDPTAGGGPQQLYIMDADGSALHAIPNTSGAQTASWSPDGLEIAFGCTDPAPPSGESAAAICIITTTGTGLRRVNHSGFASFSPAWSPDGLRIAFVNDSIGGDYDVYAMSPLGANLQPLTNDAYTDQEPVWSPNGTRLAFWRDGAFGAEIYVLDIGTSQEHAVTTVATSATQPSWANTGADVWFTSGPDLFAVGADSSALRQVTTGCNSCSWATWAPAATAP